MTKKTKWDYATEMEVYTPTSQDIYSDYQREECNKLQQDYINSNEGKND